MIGFREVVEAIVSEETLISNLILDSLQIRIVSHDWLHVMQRRGASNGDQPHGFAPFPWRFLLLSQSVGVFTAPKWVWSHMRWKIEIPHWRAAKIRNDRINESAS